VYPNKSALNIFELADLNPGSNVRQGWLPEPYALRTLKFEFPRTKQPIYGPVKI